MGSDPSKGIGVSLYEFGVFGSISPSQHDSLARSIEEMIDDFDLSLGKDVAFHDARSVARRDKSAAFVAAYFGNPGHLDSDVVKKLLQESVPVIPTVGPSDNFRTHIPEFLQTLNGLQCRDHDSSMTELTSAMMEAVGLLRRQRRVFVSYRRIESKAAAVQIHDILASRCFDVFLDTHDIRVGDPFQDVLWHRLCDSDVMIMLETPTYFDSKWTRQEIGRALAKGIHVLRIVWPEHEPNRLTGLAKTIYLEVGDLSTLR